MSHDGVYEITCSFCPISPLLLKPAKHFPLFLLLSWCFFAERVWCDNMSNMHLMLISSFVFVQIHQCASVGMASATRSHAAAAAHADDHRAAAAAHRAARSGVERKPGRDEGAAAAAAIDASDVPPMPAKRTRSAVASLSLQLEDFDIGEEEEKGMDEGRRKTKGTHLTSWSSAGTSIA